jgi:hypothetical protein
MCGDHLLHPLGLFRGSFVLKAVPAASQGLGRPTLQGVGFAKGYAASFWLQLAQSPPPTNRGECPVLCVVGSCGITAEDTQPPQST